jgi:asparagine synthase (glutamine-hydrolysing)
MSGICGIVQRDGAPARAEELRRMVEAMAFWGPEGAAEVTAGPVAMARLLRHDTPEDCFDAQPLRDGAGLFSGTARLDNRDVLLRHFGIPAEEAARTPDSELLYRAWRRWGGEAHRHVRGDWHFAAWDSDRREVTLMRDHFGITAFFYYQDARRFAFASSIKALLALPFVPKQPDLIRVAQVLVVWMGDGARTGYEALRAVPAGHTVTCTNRGVEVKRFWRVEDVPSRSWKRDEDFFEEFLDTYSAAVRCRLRTQKPVAATLSAGFDSGSVVALAGPMLRDEGRPLTAYTSVPAFDIALQKDTRMGNEWDAAHESAVIAGVGRHVPVDCAGVSMREAIAALVDTHDCCAHGATNQYWMRRLLRMARADGNGVLLTGQLGNASVSYNGNGLLSHHLRRGDWGAMWDCMRKMEPNAALVLKRQVVKPLVLFPRDFLRARLPRAFEVRLQGSAIRRDFVEEMGLRDLVLRASTDLIQYPARELLNRYFFYTPGFGRANEHWRELAAVMDLSVRDPTADLRLVELCQSAPLHYFRRNGVHRWLLRQVMRGKMADSVLDYRRKGLQAADIPYRVRAESAEWKSTLDGLASHPLVNRVVDLRKMRGILETLEKQITDDTASQVHPVLCLGTGAALFLSRFQDCISGG